MDLNVGFLAAESWEPEAMQERTQWLRENDPEALANFYPNLTPKLRVNHAGGGETGAIQVHHNPVAREHYHTDWRVDRRGIIGRG